MEETVLAGQVSGGSQGHRRQKRQKAPICANSAQCAGAGMDLREKLYERVFLAQSAYPRILIVVIGEGG